MKIFLQKIKWWLTPGKHCKSFCPKCEYYDLCKNTPPEERKNG